MLVPEVSGPLLHELHVTEHVRDGITPIWCHHFYHLSRGPQPLAADQHWSRPVRNQAARQEVSLSVMHWNHPETFRLFLVCGKIVFHETGPWCQRGWDHRSRASVEDCAGLLQQTFIFNSGNHLENVLRDLERHLQGNQEGLKANASLTSEEQGTPSACCSWNGCSQSLKVTDSEYYVIHLKFNFF